ncbi:unnamed protein product [Schistosoma mattheei]|uniref:DH domain-containing protein n=1 Tax=Schistosoma mattheei TaxID=31246 RepID=A0AA85BAA6_9TREM|nr:unnamed protein product [Schistosoma mattheei]
MKNSFSLRTNNSNAEVKLLRSKDDLIHELVTSEIKYISYLRKVLKYFARPLIDRRYLPEDIHSEIFGRLVPILSVNETLLESVLTVGVEKAFLKISPCLKLYADYANRYQTNVVFMETCNAFIPGLMEFINKQESLPDVNLQLSALLIMPIQRIPRYSLILQELVIICLQLDGLSNPEANKCAISINEAARQHFMIPEYAATLILKLSDNHHQVHYSPESHDSSFSDLKRYIHRMCASTIILIAGFASVVATATFLNEQIRISEQATKAALLQSRLFGKWSQNLILVPGRKLLKYGLVKKVNSLDGVAETRLLVIMSDILICAKPRTQTELEFIFSKKKCVYSRKYPNPFTQFYGRKMSLGFIKHIRKSNDTNSLIHVPKFSKSVSQSSNSQTFNDSTDFLTDSKVCFSCVAVYPLHHCHVQIHFKPHNTFLQPIPESPECCQSNQNNSVFISPISIGGFSRHTASTPLAFDEYACGSTSVVRLKSDSFITFNEDDYTMRHPEPLNEYSFTVHCRDANFTIVNGNLTEAEDWISSLETAIQAVKTARKSLRKESSAKWPMRASDFIQFEQWLEQKRIVEESMKSSRIFQRMGMEELTIDNPLSPVNFLESSRMEQKLEEYRRQNNLVNASVLYHSNDSVRLLSITSIADKPTSNSIPFNTRNHLYSSDRCYHLGDTHRCSFPSQLAQSFSGCLCM